MKHDSKHLIYFLYQKKNCKKNKFTFTKYIAIQIEIAERNINNLRYADDATLKAESEEELKSLLMKVQEESEKAGVKAQHSEN